MSSRSVSNISCIKNVIFKLYSRMVCLMYLLVQSCFLLSKYFCFKMAIVSRATTDLCFWENARKMVILLEVSNRLVKKRSRLCLESYNQIKINELFFLVCVHNFQFKVRKIIGNLNSTLPKNTQVLKMTGILIIYQKVFL